VKGSDHLDFLIDHRLFRPVSSDTIENLYRRYAPNLEDSFEFVTRSQVDEGTVKKEEIVLPAGAHVEVAKRLEVPELSGEVERAIWQIEQAFAKEASAQEQQQKQKQIGGPSHSTPGDEKHDERK